MKVLITGANGFVGRNLAKSLSSKYEITTITRNDLDLLDRQAVLSYFKGKMFDVLIHTAVEGGSRLSADTGEVAYRNITMFYNLLSVQHAYKKFIHFGSGAELDRSDVRGTHVGNTQERFPIDPYGLSKNVIARLIDNLRGFYNIRIFAVFGEDEPDTRFIKASLKKYIDGNPIEIYQNKSMDFFYIKDLIALVDYYINSGDRTLPKTVDCSYSNYTTLKHIAEIINSLDEHKVGVVVGAERGTSYTGRANKLIPFIGLEQGIINVYNSLLYAN